MGPLDILLYSHVERCYTVSKEQGGEPMEPGPRFLEHDDALVTLLSRPALPAERPGVHTQLGPAGMEGTATPMARANIPPGRRCSASTCHQERGGEARWSRDPPVHNLAVHGNRAGSSAHDRPASAHLGTAADKGRWLVHVTTVLRRWSGACW